MLRLVTLGLMAFFIQSSFASETVNGAKKDLEKFKQEMSVELQTAQKKIDALSEKAEKKSDQVYKDAVKDLTEKRDKLQAELNSLEADSKGQWKQAKSKLSTSLDSLNERIQKALKD